MSKMVATKSRDKILKPLREGKLDDKALEKLYNTYSRLSIDRTLRGTSTARKTVVLKGDDPEDSEKELSGQIIAQKEGSKWRVYLLRKITSKKRSN